MRGKSAEVEEIFFHSRLVVTLKILLVLLSE